jgi:GR25 family glycosyltransferase involved in LPS biosynthesis
MKNIQVLVISLTGSIERLERVNQEMDKTNLNWNFLDAVDTQEL